MRAYKFLLDNYKAMYDDFQYMIGETYVHNGDIEPCEAGFHASKEIRDAIQYCSGSHLVEVELDGKIIEGEDRVVASEITILRELDLARELEVLAGDEYWRVRRGVAQNPNTPVKLLETLAGDKDEDVRCGVAENPNTSVKILETLVGDKDIDVRCGVAENPNTPIKILETLARDKDIDVRCGVAENPNTPIKILEILALDEHWRVHHAIARNPNTPIKILETLARDKDSNVCCASSASSRLVNDLYE